jgi:hypothetical protein
MLDSLSGDVVVVVNTLDPTYYRKVYQTVGTEVYSTPSNGTPELGKQNATDLFLMSDWFAPYTHLCLVDGDDWFLPGAHQTLCERYLADVTYLVGENILMPAGVGSWSEFDATMISGTTDINQSFEFFVDNLTMCGHAFHRTMIQSRRALESVEYTDIASGLEDLVYQCDLRQVPDLTHHYVVDPDVYVYDRTQSGGVINNMMDTQTDYFTKISQRYPEGVNTDYKTIVTHNNSPLTNIAKRRAIIKHQRKHNAVR